MPALKGLGNTETVPALTEDPSLYLDTRGNVPKTQALCSLLRVQLLGFYDSGCKKYKPQHEQVVKISLWCKKLCILKLQIWDNIF